MICELCRFRYNGCGMQSTDYVQRNNECDHFKLDIRSLVSLLEDIDELRSKAEHCSRCANYRAPEE